MWGSTRSAPARTQPRRSPDLKLARSRCCTRLASHSEGVSAELAVTRVPSARYPPASARKLPVDGSSRTPAGTPAGTAARFGVDVTVGTPQSRPSRFPSGHCHVRERIAVERNPDTRASVPVRSRKLLVMARLQPQPAVPHHGHRHIAVAAWSHRRTAAILGRSPACTRASTPPSGVHSPAETDAPRSPRLQRGPPPAVRPPPPRPARPGSSAARTSSPSLRAQLRPDYRRESRRPRAPDAPCSSPPSRDAPPAMPVRPSNPRSNSLPTAPGPAVGVPRSVRTIRSDPSSSLL